MKNSRRLPVAVAAFAGYAAGLSMSLQSFGDKTTASRISAAFSVLLLGVLLGWLAFEMLAYARDRKREKLTRAALSSESESKSEKSIGES